MDSVVDRIVTKLYADEPDEDDLVLHNALVVLTELARTPVWETDKPWRITRAALAQFYLAKLLDDE